MIENSQKPLPEIVNTIVDDIDPDRIVLFGSNARGDARPNSDLDLLVIVEEPFGPDRSRRKAMARLSRKLAQFGGSQDLLLFSREDVDRWRDSINHVIGRALREGKDIYERPG